MFNGSGQLDGIALQDKVHFAVQDTAKVVRTYLKAILDMRNQSDLQSSDESVSEGRRSCGSYSDLQSPEAERCQNADESSDTSRSQQRLLGTSSPDSWSDSESYSSNSDSQVSRTPSPVHDSGDREQKASIETTSREGNSNSESQMSSAPSQHHDPELPEQNTSAQTKTPEEKKKSSITNFIIIGSKKVCQPKSC